MVANKKKMTDKQAEDAKRQKSGGRKSPDECVACNEKWSSPNPLSVSASLTLPRCKGFGLVCDVLHRNEKMGLQGKCHRLVEAGRRDTGNVH